MRWNKKKRRFVPWAVRNPEAFLERWYREHGLGFVWDFRKMILGFEERLNTLTCKNSVIRQLNIEKWLDYQKI